MRKHVVVIGKGGREHALAYGLRKSAEVTVIPGRAGIPGSSDVPLESSLTDLFVIGPEEPLVGGLADDLRGQRYTVFGPGIEGAQLEGSKIWMKSFLDEAGIPTAPWEWFGAGNIAGAEKYLKSLKPPYVIKTDGLAAGKGTFVTFDPALAIEDARTKLNGYAFGDAGRRIVIEEGLSGPELSFLAVCNGSGWVLLPSARDYKRLLNGDRGPNTGGMGAFSPVPDSPGPDVLGPIIDATTRQLKLLGIDYRGALYGGLMLTEDGPKMLEYNIRFGDPETQVIVPRLRSDLTELLFRAGNGERLPEVTEEGACVTVVLASEGYPTSPVKGDVITGIRQAGDMEGVLVFHSGTALDENDNFITDGGRVLSVTASGATIKKARELAYRAVKKIHFRGMQYRTDIAEDVE